MQGTVWDGAVLSQGGGRCSRGASPSAGVPGTLPSEAVLHATPLETYLVVTAQAPGKPPGKLQ